MALVCDHPPTCIWVALIGLRVTNKKMKKMFSWEKDEVGDTRDNWTEDMINVQ